MRYFPFTLKQQDGSITLEVLSMLSAVTVKATFKMTYYNNIHLSFTIADLPRNGGMKNMEGCKKRFKS